jgi:hypothetical protein
MAKHAAATSLLLAAVSRGTACLVNYPFQKIIANRGFHLLARIFSEDPLAI